MNGNWGAVKRLICSVGGDLNVPVLRLVADDFPTKYMAYKIAHMMMRDQQ